MQYSMYPTKVMGVLYVVSARAARVDLDIRLLCQYIGMQVAVSITLCIGYVLCTFDQ